MSGYWDLLAIIQSDREEARRYAALPPEACPRCGQPLDLGWVSVPGGGRELYRHCDAGHYAWQGGPRET